MKLYAQADRIATEEAVVIPLGYGRWHLLVKPWVKLPLSVVGWTYWEDVIIEPH